MLSQELRPWTWKDVAGQKENIKILKAILKNPENSPKTLIFEGAFGTGKSSFARIMARELNNITDRDFDTLNSPFYYEFDSTVIGNVEEIRKLRETFSLSYGNYWRVIVFDEAHAVSNTAQTALLKILEEVQGKNFFILATTHAHKLLPTIRSRSLELHFSEVPNNDIVGNLTSVAESKNIIIPDDIKEIIADRSGGHMRNAHMLLDKFVLLGEEDFRDSIKSSIDLYCKLLGASYLDKKDVVLESLNALLDIPKDTLQNDWNTFITEAMRVSCGFDGRHNSIKALVDLYKKDFNIIIECYFSPWFMNAFVDMPYFQASMLQMYTKIKSTLAARNAQAQGGQQVQQSQVQNNRILRR